MVLEGLNWFALKKCISLESFQSAKVFIFFNADSSQTLHKFMNQLFTDTPMLVMAINADGIQACFFLGNTISYHLLNAFLLSISIMNC